MRLRRGTAIALLAGGGAVTTMLVGLVTNAVSETANWPSWLGWLQRHPWLSFVILGAAMVGLSVLLAAMSERETEEDGREPLVRSDDGVRPPGAALVLRSLPGDIGAFTNRSTELADLVRSVEVAQANGTALPVHVIDGMPGVGKTAFAVRAGHELASRFPDGQLFVSLNGHTPGRSPVQPTEALASLLAATGVPAQQIPVGEDIGAVTEARAAMWRGQLADRKALLILDNAASYRQLEPLLPGGSGCLVLVTSRRRLAAAEEVVLPVKALPSEHAIDLFTRLSGRPAEDLDTVALAELVRLCGYLPLGLSLLAARLRHHPTWSVEDLRRRLIEARDRSREMQAGDRAVAAAFDLSYRDLPPERQRFFRRLGFYPGTDIDAYVGAALDSISVAQARQHLDALYDDHLIDENPGNRYRLHDLLRDYARGLAEEGDSMQRAETVERVCGYYLAALASANGHLARGSAVSPDHAPPGPGGTPSVQVPVLETRSTALQWLDGERPNVLACIEQANDLSLHSKVVELAAAMAPFLRQAGPWDQAVDLHRTAVEAARRLGDQQATADALAELGVVRRFMANYPHAADALNEAVELYTAVDDRRGKAAALNQAGIVWYLTADNGDAARAQSEALEIYRELGDRLGQANALADLGMVRRQTSRFDAAVEAQSEALAIYRELGDGYGEANSLRDLGVVHGLMGDYAQAAQHQRDAYAIYRDLDDRVHQAYALTELGVVQRLTGDFEGSREGLSLALEHYTELGDRFGQANSIRHLGALDRLKGNLPRAVEQLDEALEVYRALGSRGGEAAALGELGAARGSAGEVEVGIEAFENSLSIYRELGDRCGEAEVLNHWGDLLRSTGRQDEGRTQFEAALHLARDIRSPLEEARALDGLGRCGQAIDGPSRAEPILREALAIYRRIGAEPAAAEIERLLTAQPG
ncbi:cyclophane-containing RiPP biosynthesis TPR protein HaaT [Streptomyces monticola]|uniref:Cyclophane-containing RiPP biosynthesis TPR protein HaaT n=1 Tax=Streptomyces monticola TaxID=2666263 RepID=A0ABW2JAY8_9ACTN